MHVSQPPGPTGQIHSEKDLKANNTQPCEVFGTYAWIDPRQKTTQDAPPHNGWQAAVRLQDGTIVYLQPTWEAAAIRTQEELTKYQNKDVVVTGTLLPASPPPPDARAYITGPCFVGPVSIVDRSTWDAMHGGKLDW